MMRALALLLLTGCGGGVIQRVDALPPPPRGMGFVQIHAEPAALDIFVDDRYFGRVDRWQSGVVRLPAGAHRLSLQKTGYYPWYGQIVAGEQAATLNVRLVPKP
jgi:hypothetical protein